MEGLADQLLGTGGFRDSRVAMSVEPVIRAKRGTDFVGRENAAFQGDPINDGLWQQGWNGAQSIAMDLTRYRAAPIKGCRRRPDP